MKWNAFNHQGTVYDLSHLHPFELLIVQPATAKDPERPYRFRVAFSLHCFTQSIVDGDDPALAYRDNRETRTFCFTRYRLSRYLPDIIQGIGARKCLHTGKGNFFVVELVDDDGTTVEYEIYFDVRRATAKRGMMKIFVQSAYVRDTDSRPYRRHGKSIRFYVIAFNRQMNKPIKMPR